MGTPRAIGSSCRNLGARRMVKFRRLLLTALAVTFGQPSSMAQDGPTPPPPGNATPVQSAEVDSLAYIAKRFGLSRADAERRLALQDEAAQWAERLVVSAPAGFVDIDIEHEPSFVVNVYFARDASQAEVAQLAPPELRRYVKARRVRKAKAAIQDDIQTIFTTLSGTEIEYAVYSDLRSNKIVIELVDQNRRQEVLALLPSDLRADTLIKQGKRTINAGGIYSGNWYLKGGPSGLHCTAAWALRNSRGQPSIITAAHCSPQNPYFPYVDSGIYLGAPYASRQTVSGGKTYDWTIYLLGVHYTSYLSYVDNNVVHNGYVNSVPGFADGYYTVSDTIKTASQLRGYLMCKNGAITGLSCGEILSTSFSNPSNGEYGLMQVGNSSQPNIAAGGDSGAPVFTYPNGTQIRAAGILKSVSANAAGGACQNSTSCYMVYMPLSYAAEVEPFTVNTSIGFRTP